MAPLLCFQGNSYGPALKVRQKFPPRLVLVHGWLFPGRLAKGAQRSLDVKNSAWPCLQILGDRFLSSAGAGGNCARPMRLPDPSPVLDKNRAPMGPEIWSSTGLLFGISEGPLVYPYPQNRENSDHGLSFPSPETQIMVWVSPFPGKYRVWGGLGFGPSFSRTMVWVSSSEVRNTGVGVDEWALNFQTPVLYWINFSLRDSHCEKKVSHVVLLFTRDVLICTGLSLCACTCTLLYR